MNCTAWNSVRANAETNRPSAMPEQRVQHREHDDQPGVEPATCRSSRPKRDDATRAPPAARPARRTPGRSRPAGRASRAACVISRSSVPVVRSRSIAIDVTRNIEMSGKMPTQRHARCARTSPACPSNTYLISAIEHARHDEQQRDRARVAAQLQQHPPAGGQGHPGAHDAPSSPTRRRKACSTVVGAGARAAAASRRRRGEDGAVAHQHEVVAAVGLVHHVARDEQRRAARRPARGSVPTGRARSTGSRPTVGSSSTSSRGSPSSAVASDTRARWPPERRPTGRSARASRSTVGDRLVDPLGAGRRARGRSSAGSRGRSGRRRPTGACVT